MSWLARIDLGMGGRTLRRKLETALGLRTIAGPYTCEVGYELLYWIPYLNWLREEYWHGVTVLTRGGAGVWYPPEADVVHVDRDFPPLLWQELKRRRSMATGQKSFGLSDPLDREICERLGCWPDVHPSDMWSESWQFRRWQFHLLPKLDLGEIRDIDGAPLPERFVAVKIYHSDILTPEAQPELNRILAASAAGLPLVVLEADMQIDGHESWRPRVPCRVVRYSAERSLEIISRVVCNAAQFISTYGGISYLGPLYEVPTVALGQYRNAKKHEIREQQLQVQTMTPYHITMLKVNS